MAERKGQWTSMLGLVAALAGCGGGATPGPATAPSVVGSAGGTVTGDGGASVSVPGGALDHDVTITISREASAAPPLPYADSVEPVSSVFTITPHGLGFQAPVTVTLPIDPALVRDGDQLVVLKAQPAGTWVVHAEAVRQGASVAVAVRDFSVFLVGRRAAPPAPVPFTITTAVSGTPPDLTVTHRFGGSRPDCTRGDLLETVYVDQAIWSCPGTFGGMGSCFDYTDAFAVEVPGLAAPGQPLLVADHPFPAPALGFRHRGFVKSRYTCRREQLAPGKISSGTWTMESSMVELPLDPAYQQTAGLVALREDIPDVQASAGVPTPSRARVQLHASTLFLTGARWLISRDGEATWTMLLPTATLTLDDSRHGAAAEGHYLAEGLLPAFVNADDGALVRFEICVSWWDSAHQVSPIFCTSGAPHPIRLASAPVAPTFTAMPAPIAVVAGAGASFSVAAGGFPAPTLQWQRRAPGGGWTDLPGEQATTFGLPATSLADDGLQFRATAANASGTTTSAIATLNVVDQAAPPGVLRSSGDLVVERGGSAVFAATVTGTAPLGYQWRHDGVALPGADSPILRLDDVALDMAGRYTLEVSNPAGSAQSPALALSVIEPGTLPASPPVILTQPAPLLVDAGNTATFAVGVSGSDPMTFQWRKDDVAIAGATGAAITLVDVTPADAGAYSVVVGNAAGSVTSGSAPLDVSTGSPAAIPPAIVAQPADATAVAGTTATFAVSATGAPLRFQWTRGGVAIPGATAAAYTTPDLTVGDDGASFSVLVYNGAGLVLSQAARLTVHGLNPPGMALFVGDFVLGGGGGSADATGLDARLDTPEGLVADAAGNLYVAESNAAKAAKIAPDGVVTTLFQHTHGVTALALGLDGSLYLGAACGMPRLLPPLVAGAVNDPVQVGYCVSGQVRGIVADEPGDVLLSLPTSNALARVVVSGGVTTFPVFVGAPDLYVSPGTSDGNGLAARFSGPQGLVRAPDGTHFVADTENHTIRKVTPQGDVTTWIGQAGAPGLVDGNGAAARLHRPTQLAFDASGNLFVLTQGDPSAPVAHVRRITPAGDVTTLFNATEEVLAIATAAEAPWARQIRGLAVLGSDRVALTAGNAIVLRTLP